MIEETENKIKQVDNLLTTLKSVLKKHWGILMLIAIGAFIYWAVTTEEPTDEYQDGDEYQEEVYDDVDSTDYSQDEYYPDEQQEVEYEDETYEEDSIQYE